MEWLSHLSFYSVGTRLQYVPAQCTSHIHTHTHSTFCMCVFLLCVCDVHCVYVASWLGACAWVYIFQYSILQTTIEGVLSQLVPVTVVLILTVLLFNISFTSWSVNGFILFSQQIGSLDVDASGIIVFPDTAKDTIKHAKLGYQVIYGLFYLDIFNSESLSFCLWKGASALDMFAFKYISLSSIPCYCQAPFWFGSPEYLTLVNMHHLSIHYVCLCMYILNIITCRIHDPLILPSYIYL